MEGSEPRSARGSLWAMYHNDLYHVEAARIHIHSEGREDCGIELTLDALKERGVGIVVEICGSHKLSELIQRYAHMGTENEVLILKLNQELSWIRLPRREFDTIRDEDLRSRLERYVQ